MPSASIHKGDVVRKAVSRLLCRCVRNARNGWPIQCRLLRSFWRAAALGAVLAWQSAPATAQELGQFIRWCEGKDTDSYEKAADACTTVIDSGYRSGAGLSWAFVNRGLWSDNLGRYDRAIQDFDEAIRLAPDNALVFTNRCMTRATIGQLESALADCNRALELRPNVYIALVWRGLVHLKMGHHDAALADEDASLSVDPKGATALYLRGIIFRRKGDEAHARADIAAAVAINPKVSAEIAKRGVK